MCRAHVGGFWVQNSLNKGPLRQIFLKHGCVFKKLAKNCQKLVVFAKIHHKSGYDGNCR